MSWFFKSLQTSHDSEPSSSGGDRSTSPENSRGGVKDDISIIGETIGRQLRGVAAFLAPPPSPSVSVAASEHVEEQRPSDSSSQQALIGIRNDLMEIGGSVKSGLSRLSSNKAVVEISKMASNFLQFSDVDEGEREARKYVSEVDEFDEVRGITNETVDFAKEISTRPEYWTDFPVSLDNDFEMSDAQREHASAIEHLVPSIASTKGKVSGCTDNEQFWLIYFVLLLPRLNGLDLQILATPKVVETTEMLLQKLQKKKREIAESTTSAVDDKAPQGGHSTEIESEIGRKTTEEGRLKMDHKDNAHESSEETRRNSAEEDISFSDLEDNDDKLLDKPSSSRKNAEEGQSSSPGGSSDWVRLNRSPGTCQKGQQPPNLDSEGESSDWLAIDDSD